MVKPSFHILAYKLFLFGLLSLSIYTPSDNTWGSATASNWAGEVIRVNIISGDDYEFSTCSGYGSVNASYDTQLTLIDELGAVVDFNDDFSGCSGYTSYIKHTATYTGVLYVHLNEYVTDAFNKYDPTSVALVETLLNAISVLKLRVARSP